MPAWEFGGKVIIAGAVDDRIHVHVTGDVRRQFGAFAGEDVHYAAGQIAGGENFGKGSGGQWKFFGRNDDDASCRCTIVGAGLGNTSASSEGSSGASAMTTPWRVLVL